jgi:hypothetical protein
LWVQDSWTTSVVLWLACSRLWVQDSWTTSVVLWLACSRLWVQDSIRSNQRLLNWYLLLPN